MIIQIKIRIRKIQVLIYLIKIGFVLANDNNVDRTFLMTHQLKRINKAGMIVTNHDAQGFPNLYNDKNEAVFTNNNESWDVKKHKNNSILLR